jgi:hypothetical protein
MQGPQIGVSSYEMILFTVKIEIHVDEILVFMNTHKINYLMWTPKKVFKSFI